MHRILVTSRSFAKTSKEPINFLEGNDCEVVFTETAHLTGKELAKLIPGYDALIVGIDQVTKEVLEAAKQLKVICMHGTGVDHIDVEAASKSGVYVGNAPGGNTNAVAELTIGLMIDVIRHISYGHNSIKDFNWKRKIGIEISNKTIGIIGLGHIGKRVVQLLKGFDVEILAFDQYKDIEFAKEMNITYTSLEYLLSNSQIVSLHIPLLPETNKLISEKELKIMRKDAYLINTSRGALIDEKALYNALKNKEIAGAALDAFGKEPLEDDSPLRSLENIILTPHLAASTLESSLSVDMTNAHTIVSVLTGKKPYSVINENELSSLTKDNKKII